MMYVAVEPPLQPLNGESLTVSSTDIDARGFWG